MTALLVARPVVLGEDPGLLSSLSSGTNLVLTGLWLLLAAGWGLWRALDPAPRRAGGAEEAAFAVLVGTVFLSAYAAANYRHPAVLIAWEWVALLFAFGLVRRLARTPAENQALLAAVVASTAALAVHGIYQYFVEMPQYQAEWTASREHLAQALRQIGEMLTPDDPRLEAYQRRIAQKNIFATYAHPNSLAGVLALVLPVAIGWTMAAQIWRRRQPDERTGRPRNLIPALTAATTACITLALWFTHSRGAILGFLLAGGLALALVGRSFLRRHLAKLVGGLVAAVVTGVLLLQLLAFAEGLGKARESFGLRTGYWSATWPMILDHPWLGVGPGNFGRHYTRYMAATAHEKVSDPHNFALEIWATCGVFALVALLTTCALIGRRLVPSGPEEREPAVKKKRAGWEFYIGGMLGLVLGFVLRAADQSGDLMAVETVFSTVRAVVWFGVFALLGGIPWAARPRLIALTTGLVASLLNLTVSGGIAQPSVAVFLWVLAALALNTAAESRPAAPAGRPLFLGARFVPVVLLGGVALFYLLNIYQPVTGALAEAEEARRHAGDDPQLPGWRNEIRPRLFKEMAAASDQVRQRIREQGRQYLKTRLLEPLERAVRLDPGFTTPRLDLTGWYVELWDLFPDIEGLASRALDQARDIERLDRDGRDGFLWDYRINLMKADRFKDNDKVQVEAAAASGKVGVRLASAGSEKDFLQAAATALRAVVDRDPTEASLHYLLAELEMRRGELGEGRRQAEEALRLHDLSTAPERRLTAKQLEQVRTWLRAPAGS